jgi:hypothetical protein
MQKFFKLCLLSGELVLSLLLMFSSLYCQYASEDGHIMTETSSVDHKIINESVID